MGQVCISPDYVFVEAARLESFIATAIAQFSQMFPNIIDNEHYSSMINQRHFERLRHYISDTQSKGGDIRIINPANENFDTQVGTHKLPMTLVINPSDDMLVMQEEIFGPIISIKSYQTIDEVINYINQGARPLALYYFGDDTAEQAQVLARTTSGGVCINDTVMQAGVEDIPFGGIGASGMGSYHGIEGFKTFSHAKAVFKQSKINIMKFTGMIPPYSEKTDKTVAFMLKK
jgi:coniferyl-aldehyde dehydrogenase